MTKPIIAIDIDDVLSASAADFVAYSNRKWGTSLNTEDYQEHWAEMWQLDLQETERRADMFHQDAIVAHYKMVDHSLPVLKSLAEDYDLVAITSRRRSIEPHTREWIERHYSGLFTDVQFAGIFDGKLTKDRYLTTKADLFTRNNVAYVIDDQLKHCLAAAELGISTLLFGSYTWNQSQDPLPSLVQRVGDWPAVAKYFEKLQHLE